MADQAPKDLLPERDREFLDSCGFEYEVLCHNNLLHVILSDIPFPKAYEPRNADVLIILPAGYPDANPDMFFTRPDIKLTNGNWPDRCQRHVTHAGQTWQQWSRHFPNGRWRIGVDCFQTYLTAIRREISRGR